MAFLKLKFNTEYHFVIISGKPLKYKTRKEQKKIPTDRETFTEDDLKSLLELQPPPLMPQGNVGTPTGHFLHLIQQCKLPPVIIKKLGLTFPKQRSNRKYGNVPLEYGGEILYGPEDEEYTVKSAGGHDIIKEDEVVLSGTSKKRSSADDKLQEEDDRKSEQSEEVFLSNFMRKSNE